MKRLAAILLLVSSSSNARVLSLREAVDLALQNSPGFNSVKKNVEISELGEKSAFAQFLPSLDATGSVGLGRSTPAGPTDPDSSSLSLTATENLYDNGISYTNYKTAKLTRQINELNEKKEKDKLCLDVASLFYTYSLSIKLLQLKKDQLMILKKIFETVESQYRQGLKTKKDYLRFSADVQKAEVAVLDADNAIRRSQNDLLRILGGPREVDFRAVEADPKLLAIPRGRLDFSATYIHQIAQLQREKNGLNVDLAIRQYWPQVGLQLAANYANANFINSGAAPFSQGSESYGWKSLLTLTYNFWDWGIRRRQIEVAEANRDIANNSARADEISGETDFKNLGLDLGSREKSYDVQKRLLEAQSQSYELIQRDFREGKVAYLDMITSLQDLLLSKIDYYTSFFSLLNNVAQYRYYEGTIYEKLIH